LRRFYVSFFFRARSPPRSTLFPYTTLFRSAGERLMGFGHRVFRVRDPRADILRGALARLGPDAGRLAFAADVERRVLAALAQRKPGRTLQTNVELNAALLLEAVGLPREAFTPVFALARSPGWIAHALEQRRTGRMIRPQSRYLGPAPCPFAGRVLRQAAPPMTDDRMSKPLADRIALVTGASRGIGYVTAQKLAAAGAHVVAVARTVGGLEELDDAIR